MKNDRTRTFAISAALTTLMTLIGTTPADEPAPKVPEVVAANVARLDRNGDKRLAVDEFQAASAAAQLAVALRNFDLFDRDGDGVLSLAEYWSLPTGVSANQRGPISDPMKEVVDQFVAVLDGLLDDWDQKPEQATPVNTFLAAFTKALNEPLTARMQQEADPNLDRKVSREEARRFVEIQSGVRRSDGQLLRLPDGRLVQHLQFLNADQDRDDRLDKTEFLARAWSPLGKGPETFALTDADKDGFVTWLEWSKIRFSDPIAEFRRMDINFDGQLEPAEVLAGTPDWCKLSAQVACPAFDRDRSGKLSLDEFRPTFFANPVATWHVMIADIDFDGLISRQEFSYGGAFPVLRFVYFKMLDANRDGQLDPNEFLFNRKTPREVCVVNADGTGWKKLFAIEKTMAVHSAKDYRQIYWIMTWSPDSQRICFKGLKADATEEIATVGIDPDKPQLKVHISGKNISTDFAWHPDGNRIVFFMYCPERALHQLYEFNPNSAEPPQLLKGQDPTTTNTSACWTPDGKQMIVITGDY